MNVEFWKKHQNTSQEDATKALQKSHKDVLKLAENFTNEELFSKKFINGLAGVHWDLILSVLLLATMIGL